MNLLPEKFEVIDLKLYEELCEAVKLEHVLIESKIDYKYSIRNSLTDLYFEDGTDNPEKVIKDLNLDLIYYFQFPFVQRTETLEITELVRFEINLRVMNLLYVIDDLNLKNSIMGLSFLYQQILNTANVAVSTDAITILTKEDILSRLTDKYDSPFNNWQDIEGNSEGVFYLKTSSISIIDDRVEEISSPEIEFYKTLFYVYHKLGIIDFLGEQFNYHHSAKNLYKLNGNKEALGRVLNVLMGVNWEKGFNRKYFEDHIQKGKDYTDKVRDNGEEVLKKLKIQKRTF